MKKLLIGIAIASALLLTGCTTETPYGNCIGIDDNKDPALIYKIDEWNVFLGIIFSESLIVPIIVIVDDLYCPIGKQVKQ